MPKAKILTVDDEPFICQLLASRLEANDYDVITANNETEAIDKALEEKPDLILLDIIMPEMDGFKTLGELKANEATKSIPVIMLTAKGTQDSIFKAVSELGAVGYIIKPFTSEILLEEVKKALEKNEQGSGE